jgi:riboflavin kinase / FMN adenylyltransferase
VPPRRIDGARALGAPRASTLVAIGNFDGVHRGHWAVLAAAVARARAAGLAPLVLTFHPHPAEVLGRGRQPVLTPLDRKVELLCRTAPELRVVVEPFTRELAAMTPAQFARELLVDALVARVVIVGQNFRFGRGRSGDLAVLAELGAGLGFEAGAEKLEGDAAGAYSSSRARAAVRDGDLKEFHRIVGRPHALTGTVARGERRGRTIGFPTANLADIDEALPPFGVYACLVDRIRGNGAPERLSGGVANIGERPTVSGGFSVEAHLFDVDEDLYGSRLRLHLVERLRDEHRFGSLDELVAQIERDSRTARGIVGAIQPSPDAGAGWY